MYEVKNNPNYTFDVSKTTSELIDWVKDYFNRFGNPNAVIGMSGGKDSTVAAAILAKALGPDKVIGVAMPDKDQGINGADKISKYLGIRYIEAPINYITAGFDSIWYAMGDEDFKWSNDTLTNIPPRIRMTMLYAIAQTYHGFVTNTCNLSEDYVGYATKFGDAAGDFSPLSNLTVTEIIAIGDYLCIPHEWVHKTPDDGLPHSMPDEEKFGFTYAELDTYLRTGKVPVGYVKDTNITKIEKIELMHKANLHKLLPMPAYNPNI